jgi:hypothetical protein
MWSSGEAILLRHVLGERVLTAIPQRVIADDAASTATWVEPATRIAYPLGLAPDGSLLDPDTWTVELREWFGRGCLDLTPAGRAHMIRHFWGDGGAFAGWYVNLQDPVRRRSQGLDTTDLQLDLWIEADGTVHWKDEDHLEQAVALGMFTQSEADVAREEAERVLGEWPFPTGWEEWRPPPAWSALELPADWDIVSPDAAGV